MRQNNSVVRCNSVGVVIGKVVGLLWVVWYLVGWVVDRVRGWEMRERLRELYPNQNRPIYDNILTDAPIPIIQFPVYPTVKTVYQTEPKKIG